MKILYHPEGGGKRGRREMEKCVSLQDYGGHTHLSTVEGCVLSL